MKRRLVRLTATFLLLFAAVVTYAEPAPPAIKGEAAILVDAVSGKVLFEKACRKRMYPASTTKIMTAVLALEHAKLTDTCKATEYATKTPFGNLHLKPGETLDMENLLYGTMMRSANDGATCIAEHVAGSEAKFIEMMNAKAQEVGAKDTQFRNAHGLFHPEHYSTAYDLSLIARYAVKVPMFNEIVSTRTKRIERSMNDKDVFVKNTARFLWKYDGADGIKTGYVREAGRCFVGSATRDGWRLISVVLKSPDAGADTMALMDYGFKNYMSVCYATTTEPAYKAKVRGGVVKQLDLMPAKDLALILRRPNEPRTETKIELRRVGAPIEKGERLGTLTGYLNGKAVGTVDLVAARSVERTLLMTIWVWVRNIILIALLILIGLVVYGVQAAKVARRRRRSVSKRSGKANVGRPRLS